MLVAITRRNDASYFEFGAVLPSILTWELQTIRVLYPRS
jgi:hypothetical protein